MPSEDQQFRITRIPKSAVRKTDAYGRQVIQQGKKRLIIQSQKAPRSRSHWLLFLGLGMILCLALFVLGQWAIAGIQAHNVDVQYGYPRTFQINAVVGHNDSALHPSHFIFLNLNGKVDIIELPGGNITHARIYGGPTLFTSNSDQLPVTGKFEDVNGDGKPDMEVMVNGQTIIYLNNGTQFVPQS